MGVSAQPPLDADPPRCRPPCMQSPLEADLLDADPHWMQTSPLWTEGHTGVKTLPYSKLGLRAFVTEYTFIYFCLPTEGYWLAWCFKWSWSRHCDLSGTLKVPPKGRQQTIWLYEWPIYEVLVNTKSSSGGSRICQTRGANFPKTAWK